MVRSECRPPQNDLKKPILNAAATLDGSLGFAQFYSGRCFVARSRKPRRRPRDRRAHRAKRARGWRHPRGGESCGAELHRKFDKGRDGVKRVVIVDRFAIVMYAGTLIWAIRMGTCLRTEP